jgi:hypothetical protein
LYGKPCPCGVVTPRFPSCGLGLPVLDTPVRGLTHPAAFRVLPSTAWPIRTGPSSVPSQRPATAPAFCRAWPPSERRASSWTSSSLSTERPFTHTRWSWRPAATTSGECWPWGLRDGCLFAGTSGQQAGGQQCLPFFFFFFFNGHQGLNLGPCACLAGALPLQPHAPSFFVLVVFLDKVLSFLLGAGLGL